MHQNYTYPESTFNNLPYDGDLARKHLQLLYLEDDISTKKFIFCAFPDNKFLAKHDPNMRKNLTRTFYGTFDEHEDALRAYNSASAGIFVTVNRTDKTGKRKLTNIIAINTIYIEADHELPQDLPIPPSLKIQSSAGKFHYYFFTHTTDKEEANAVQQRLVDEYGCDPNAKDLSRVLRLAGFSHVKDKQQLVKIDSILPAVEDAYNNVKAGRTDSIIANYRYDWNEITAAFPPVEKNKYFTQQYIDAQSKITQPDTILITTILALIDPSFIHGRDEWIQIAMIIHYEYKGSQEGFDILDEWSRGEYFDKKANPHIKMPPSSYDKSALQLEWNSFSCNSLSNSVKIGTLVHIAQEKYGYLPENEPPPCVISMVPKTRDETLKKMNRRLAICTDAGGKTSFVLRRPSTGLYQFATEDSVKLKYSNVKIPVIKVTKEGTKIELKPAIPIWKEQAIRYDDVVFYPNTYDRPSTSRVTLPHASLTDGLDYSDDSDVSLTNQLSGLEALHGDLQLNMFSGYDIQPVPGDCSIILHLIHEVICRGNDEATEYFHNWVAHTRQFPRKKTGVMLTLTGAKGTGKSVASELVQGLHQPYNLKVASFDEVLGRFNDKLAYSTLLAPEEAVWGGDNRKNSVLKDFITSGSMQVEEKFKSRFTTGSFFNIIATANSGFSAPQETNDKERRFLTLTVSDLHRKDIKYFSQFGRTIYGNEEGSQDPSQDPSVNLNTLNTLNTGTLDQTYANISSIKTDATSVRVDAKRKRLLEHYCDFLMKRDLSNFEPLNLPKIYSGNAAQNMLDTADGALQFLHDAYENHEIIPIDETDPFINSEGIAADINSMWTETDSNAHGILFPRILISAKLLKDIYTKFMRVNGSKNNMQSAKSLIYRLKEITKLNIKDQQRPTAIEIQQYPSLKRSRYIQLPTREQYKAYAQETGIISPEDKP